MKVLVYGAGVIGQIYGGRMAQSGHDVTMLARGDAAAMLAAQGITLERDGAISHAQPHVVTDVPDGTAYDIVLVTVRQDQLQAVLPALAGLTATRIAFMLNQGTDLDTLRDRTGADRTIFAFPGVGGQRLADGTIRYLDIAQQHTSIESRHGLEDPVADLLRSAGFTLDIQADMSGWLKTHAVFITVVSAAVVICGGDSAVLAADRSQVAAMVRAVGEGFRALARQHITVTPTALRTIFTIVPRPIAVGYWQRQLRGPLGTLGIAPHVRASRTTELPLMIDEVRRLVAGHGPTPYLDRLLQAATREETP